MKGPPGGPEPLQCHPLIPPLVWWAGLTVAWHSGSGSGVYVQGSRTWSGNENENESGCGRNGSGSRFCRKAGEMPAQSRAEDQQGEGGCSLPHYLEPEREEEREQEREREREEEPEDLEDLELEREEERPRLLDLLAERDGPLQNTGGPAG